MAGILMGADFGQVIWTARHNVSLVTRVTAGGAVAVR
jgi:hypothetical protein